MGGCVSSSLQETTATIPRSQFSPLPLIVSVAPPKDLDVEAFKNEVPNHVDISDALSRTGLFQTVNAEPLKSSAGIIITASDDASFDYAVFPRFMPLCIPLYIGCLIPGPFTWTHSIEVSVNDVWGHLFKKYHEKSVVKGEAFPMQSGSGSWSQNLDIVTGEDLNKKIADDFLNDYQFYKDISDKLNLAASNDNAVNVGIMEQLKSLSQTVHALKTGQPLSHAKEAIRSDVDRPDYKPLPEDPNKFALVIGISKYRDIPEAQFAERDAKAMKAHLMALGYPEENIITLTGDHATKSSLVDKIERWLPMNIGPKSTVFVYYSGHGAPDPVSKQAYLVPWDGEPGELAGTALPLSQFYADLNKLPAKRVLVALDSCFSGAGGRSVLARGARPLVVQVSNDVPSNGKLIVFSASKGDQISGTVEKEGHGAFTYYFLKGLNGAGMSEHRKGHVTVGSLYHYLAPMVDAAAHRQERSQNPELLPRSDSGSPYVLR
jgi:hypothetical protein